MNRKIILIRHGETEKRNEDNVLTSKGIKQAQKVAKDLSNIKTEKVFVSGLMRAKQTCQEYSKINSNIKVVDDSRLNEIYRVIVGGSAREGTAKDREEKDKERIESFIKELDKVEGEIIVIFTHGNVIRYFLSRFLNKDPKNMWGENIDFGSIWVLEKDKLSQWKLRE